MTRFAIWIVLLLITVHATGCSDDYDALGLVDVTGNVTLDGVPLPSARVQFEDASGGGSEATTDSAGNFRLMYDSQHPGCRPGPKTVRITLADADLEGADPDAPVPESEGEGTAPAEMIPAIYNVQSTLKADVSPSTQTFSFALKSRP